MGEFSDSEREGSDSRMPNLTTETVHKVMEGELMRMRTVKSTWPEEGSTARVTPSRSPAESFLPDLCNEYSSDAGGENST